MKNALAARAEQHRSPYKPVAASLLTFVLASMSSPSTQAEPLAASENFRSLFADRRAHRVGETVQVLIIETTHAESAAGTGTISNTGVNVSGNADNHRAGGSLGINGDARGNGQTSRSGSVRSVVTAQVTALTADGNLVIDARQDVVINDEKQTIELHGVARPLDISPENDIASNRLANASIRISGIGTVSSSQRQGLLFRFLKWTRLL